MPGRSKWFIIIPAIIMIPLVLGMTPLNFIQKLGSGCVFLQDKQVQKCNPGSLNSQNSPESHFLGNHPFAGFDQEAVLSLYSPILNSVPEPSLADSELPPLRC